MKERNINLQSVARYEDEDEERKKERKNSSNAKRISKERKKKTVIATIKDIVVCKLFANGSRNVFRLFYATSPRWILVLILMVEVRGGTRYLPFLFAVMGVAWSKIQITPRLAGPDVFLPHYEVLHPQKNTNRNTNTHVIVHKLYHNHDSRETASFLQARFQSIQIYCWIEDFFTISNPVSILRTFAQIIWLKK